MVLLAGCGTDVEGTALAGERWDPCSITQDSIEATGLDPAFRDEGWESGIDVPDWSLCKFRALKEQEEYFLNVLSSELHTVDEARSNDTFFDGTEIDVAGRDAFRYRTRISDAVQDCNIAVGVYPGVVVFTVDFVGGIQPFVNPCELATAHATDLEPQLPPNPN